MKRALPVLLFLVLIAIAGWFYKAYRTVPSLPANEHVFVDEQGKDIKLSAFKGQFVLISYFQTWCGSCVRELPSIDALQSEIGKDKLSVLIVSDEPMEKILRFKEKYCNTLNYFRTDKPFTEIGIRVFPTTYLLDKNGDVIMSRLEAFDWNSTEVKNAIYLSEKNRK